MVRSRQDWATILVSSRGSCDIPPRGQKPALFRAIREKMERQGPEGFLRAALE